MWQNDRQTCKLVYIIFSIVINPWTKAIYYENGDSTYMSIAIYFFVPPTLNFN